MKKTTLIISIALLLFLIDKQGAHAQAQRLVLVEEFTQASCPPCGQQNPAFNDLLDANQDKVRSLKYQVSWPGYDPMYLQNPGQVDSRVTYYGVNGVPWGWVDGSSIVNDCGYYDGAPACLSQSDIDNEYAVPSPLTLSLSHTLSPDADSIYVTLTINAVGSLSGNLYARVAVVEKEIDFDAPPGSNGETDFENVMKKMLPNTTGTVLPSTIDSGYTTTINLSGALTNIYDLNEIAVVAFVQNDDDKSIAQAAYDEPLPALSNYATASIDAGATLSCTGVASPFATIENEGSIDMTSCTISYALNGGTTLTYDWTGSLAPGALSSSIQLPDINVPQGSNTLKVWVSKINGLDFNANLVTAPVTILGIGTPVAAPVTQDFGLVTFPPAGWLINNPNGSSTFSRSSSVGAYQTAPYGSTKYPFYTVTEDDEDEFYVPNFDFSDASQSLAYMEFDYAKAKYTGLSDELEVKASSDCGATWTTLFDKTDNSGLNTATSTSDWKPTSSNQWKTVVLDMSSFIGQSNVEVKFVTESGYGNNLYIDNVNIHYGYPVGISEPEPVSASIFPNPANDLATVRVNGIVSSDASLQVLNVLGQVVYSTQALSNTNISVNTGSLNEGCYLVRLADQGKIISQGKLDVVH